LRREGDREAMWPTVELKNVLCMDPKVHTCIKDRRSGRAQSAKKSGCSMLEILLLLTASSGNERISAFMRERERGRGRKRPSGAQETNNDDEVMQGNRVKHLPSPCL
jgi:hypothetical protein